MAAGEGQDRRHPYDTMPNRVDYRPVSMFRKRAAGAHMLIHLLTMVLTIPDSPS